MRNKFALVETIIKAFGVFLMSEWKLDCIFRFNQFYVAGFKQLRRDRNRFGGEYNENIPWKLDILNFIIFNW